MRNSNTLKLTLCALAITANIVLGIVTSMLKLPIYLDTLGTVVVAVAIGTSYGVIVGASTNILTALIYSLQDMPFLLVSVAVALVVGYAAKKFKFTLVTAVVCGLILSIVCPLIGTPIGIIIYGGITGTASDIIMLTLKASGSSIFAASFIAKVGSNLIDKVGTCIIAYFLIRQIPTHVLMKFHEKA